MSVPTNQARDPHADPLVASVARAASTTAIDCPDPELLALYAERELQADERRAVDAHLAACGRCQATVAAIVRSNPDVAETESAGPVTSLPWWAEWRWLLPVVSATAVLAVAVWIGRAPGNEVASTAASGPRPTANPSLPEAAADMARRLDPPSISTRALEERSGQGLGNTLRQRSRPQSDRANTAASAPTPAERSTLSAPAASDTASRVAQANSAAPETPASPAVAATMANEAVPAPAAPLAKAAPARAAPAEAERSRAELAEAMDSGRRDNATALPASFGWRVRDGRVERSPDGGATWTRLALPRAETVTSVSATSPNDAVVTAASGARFTTADAGTTWRRLP